jgi:hypothetical protein
MKRKVQLDPSTPDEAPPLVPYIGRRFGRNAGAMPARVGAVAKDEGASENVWLPTETDHLRLCHDGA